MAISVKMRKRKRKLGELSSLQTTRTDHAHPTQDNLNCSRSRKSLSSSRTRSQSTSHTVCRRRSRTPSSPFIVDHLKSRVALDLASTADTERRRQTRPHILYTPPTCATVVTNLNVALFYPMFQNGPVKLVNGIVEEDEEIAINHCSGNEVYLCHAAYSLWLYTANWQQYSDVRRSRRPHGCPRVASVRHL